MRSDNESSISINKPCRRALFTMLLLSILLLIPVKTFAATITLDMADSALVGSTVQVNGRINDSTPLAGVSLGITVQDPNGANVFVDQIRSDAAGLFNFQFGIPLDGTEGTWQVLVAGGNVSAKKSLIISKIATTSQPNQLATNTTGSYSSGSSSSSSYSSSSGSASTSTSSSSSIAAKPAANTNSDQLAWNQSLVSPAASLSFSDVIPSYWASESIRELFRLGYIKGYPDGTFKPGNPISRAELVTVMNKVLKLAPTDQNSVSFKDISTRDWFYNSVQNTFNAGLVKGYGNNSFAPDKSINREELASILIRALDSASSVKQDSAGKTGFVDDAAISPWARDAIALAVSNGLIKGYQDNTFSPKNQATRAEVCVVIGKFLSISRK